MPEASRLRVRLSLVIGLILALVLLGYFVFQTPADSTPAPVEARGSTPAWQPGEWEGWAEPESVAPAAEDRRPSALPSVSDAHDRVYDPQRAAMLRGFQITSLDGGAALPFEPQERRATISSLSGTVPFDAEAACTLRVLPAHSGRFNCLVRVICGGAVVYPNQAQTAGFMQCELGSDGRPLQAVDRGHTAVDGDPLVRIDLQTGELTVEDRGDGVQPFSVSMRLR